ncbi:FixH family protein [Ramlibacter rhizophilus]|uniref:Auxin-binding protein n=1 Tax=Ramlibacter rhizophilus TaxID=1781167 RepID=A0A4Z0BNW8_9BURK|nr:FixH family protein [Ramlibacter rhizophilus]TFY99967.1 Auxin-binding protein [Ramlibacter rhizophilus]
MRTFTRFLTATAVIASCAGFTGCMTPPSTLDLSREKPSAAGHYRVAIVAPTPAPAVNQLHAWKVRLAGADGRPVKGAEFSVDGGMPQHGHGYPTRPRVTRELEDGTYLLDGMKFSMTGWWDLKLGIRGSEGADAVTFNIVVDPAIPSR